MDMGDKIKQLRLERGMTLEQLGDAVGVGKSTVRKWENGIIANMRRDKIEKIANALHVSPGYLMGWEDLEPETLAGLRPIKPVRLPVLGSVSCGELKYASEDFEGYVDADQDVDADFCLIAKGDSMINIGVYDGTVVFVRRQDTVDNGDVAVVIYEDDATLKRVFYYPEQNLLVLHAENPRYKDITFVGPQLDAVRIIGRAIMYQNRIV